MELPKKGEMQPVAVSEEVERLAWTYIRRLGLPDEQVLLTERRSMFELWLGRRVSGSIGGAYAYLSSRSSHAILINVARIDQTQSRSVEIVVCEEFLHMRHWLDGDRRRHAHHGYDRIARQVAELTGASLEEIRTCLLPLQWRPYRYMYECPTCDKRILRRRKGTWSCGVCAPTFERRHQLRLREELPAASGRNSNPEPSDDI
jgi:predicted SprT family Zn-dependent metalloprotease